MIRGVSYVAAGVALLALSVSTADARSHRVAPSSRHHHTRAGYHARHRALAHDTRTSPQGGYGGDAAASSYQGPGADVFRRTLQTEQAPGVTRELDFDAKQSATGGPAGGLPSNGNGP